MNTHTHTNLIDQLTLSQFVCHVRLGPIQFQDATVDCIDTDEIKGTPHLSETLTPLSSADIQHKTHREEEALHHLPFVNTMQRRGWFNIHLTGLCQTYLLF